jgi:cytochrome c oxidase subunit 3
MSTTVAHHFDDADQQFEAASLGMWLFLATEILFFGGLFAGYAQYRYWYPEAFTAGSAHLDVFLGTLNTAVLLTSSLAMALAVRGAQTDDQKSLMRMLLATIALGTVFLVIKAFEYSAKFQHHLVPGSHFSLEEVPEGATSGQVEIFFSFYFAMTGVHALHMVIGICILSFLVWRAKQGDFGQENFTAVEMTGLYWHLVDIVWVFLFPLLYLIT